jgi:hypothetical protein
MILLQVLLYHAKVQYSELCYVKAPWYNPTLVFSDASAARVSDEFLKMFHTFADSFTQSSWES